MNTGIRFPGRHAHGDPDQIWTGRLEGIRHTLDSLSLGEVQVQSFGAPDDVLIRIVRQQGGDEAQTAVVDKVRGIFGDSVDYRRTEVVGPRVSGELAQNGILGIISALGLIMVYVWFRFEWQYSLGAVIATLHDVVLTIGFFAITQIEFNLSSIAAILTIVGYSLNDTVRGLRPNPRNAAQVQAPQPGRAARPRHQSDTDPYHQHRTHHAYCAVRAGNLWRRSDPLFHSVDAVWCGDRHLFLDLYRRTRPDLPRSTARGR